jgi:3D (Asp-Asp-Asp) domain-containing protein
MNIFLIQLISKWFGLFAVTLISIVPGFETRELFFEVNNKNNDMSLSVVTQIIDYEIEYVYSRNLPSSVKNTLVEGEDGIIYYSLNNEQEKLIKEPVNKIIEVGTGPIGEYKGTLTGYGPDCPGCHEKGYVACRTKEKKNHSLNTDGITYKDYEYDEVRILAATQTVFPCGTIVYVDNGVMEPFYGVVLDTGFTMRQSWNNNNHIWMDLAFESQRAVKNATSRNTSFSVKRWGW